VFRGYVYLRDAGFSIGDVAIKLGYTHPRIFARHIETVLGECPSKVRHALDDGETVDRIVSWVASTTTKSSSEQLQHHLAGVA
jgi:AraC-like DNA-binding protein